MPDLRRVHRFCDHPIAGVNWRPTRFVDEVPTSGVCGLCHMIPKRIVLLPCLHTLCESCQAAISQGIGGRCALDQEPFEEAECVSYDFPTRKVNVLKVYCWNHTQGCEYEGAMNDMLRHFENECTFHSVECMRCGEAVLHRELATHYVAGCSVGVSSAHIENRSLESRALTLQDVKNALEEVKMLLRDANHDHVLPVIQSHLNELTEQVRNQESRLAQITREAGASVNAETAQQGKARGVSKAMGRSGDLTQAQSRGIGIWSTAQHAATASSIVLQESSSQRNPADGASTSTSSVSCSQGRDRTVRMPPGVQEQMQKTSTQDYPQHVIYYSGPPNGACHFRLTRQLYNTCTWREVLGTVTYFVTLKNCALLPSEWGKLLCRIMVLQTRDTYFTVQIRNFYFRGLFPSLGVGIAFYGVLPGSRCLEPSFKVSTCDREREIVCPLFSVDWPCRCESIVDSQVHFHNVFKIDLPSLEHAGFVLRDVVELKIELSQKERHR